MDDDYIYSSRPVKRSIFFILVNALSILGFAVAINVVVICAALITISINTGNQPVPTQVDYLIYSTCTCVVCAVFYSMTKPKSHLD